MHFSCYRSICLSEVISAAMQRSVSESRKSGVQGENGRRREGVEEVQKPAAVPSLAGQLPSQPSLSTDRNTPRGIGRPPVRDHNMLMHGVRLHANAL